MEIWYVPPHLPLRRSLGFRSFIRSASPGSPERRLGISRLVFDLERDELQ